MSFFARLSECFRQPAITKYLTTIFVFSIVMPASALIIEEAPDQQGQVDLLYQPLADHAEKLPVTTSGMSDSGLSMVEIMKLMDGNENKRISVIESKLDNIELNASKKLIEWLSHQNALEQSLLQKLSSYVDDDNPECGILINIYRNKIISANEKTVQHLKKYKDNYKVFNFLIQWVFSLDYLNRIYSRQEALLLTNTCVNPSPYFMGNDLRQPLPDAVYIGKPIAPSLTK